jgi:hypothetical protein
MTKISNLISLASIDEKITEIESSQGDLPSRIEKIEIEKSTLDKKTEELNSKIDELNKKQSSLGIEKEESNAKLAKYKDQLYLVKNNKEYDAINAEIDMAKNAIFKISEELLEVDKNKEDIEEKIKLYQSQDEEFTQVLDKYSKQLKDSISTNEKEYNNLKLQKEKIIGTIDSNILSRYNIMFNAKGFGAAAITGNACGACYTTLPTQLIQEIKEKAEIKYCPSCAVLLYFDE